MTQSITFITTLISSSGTRFPRAVREPPRRFAPVGSPLDSHFPQESRAFRSNQLECFLKKSAAKFAGLKKYATHLPNYWLAEIPQTLALMRLGRQSAERERISENQLQLEIKKLCPPKWRVKLRLFSWF
ncbi:hypothetical protein [Peribacillus simplex]|uniref:hypothetical protein n=1 Tax=Peribacillus simplex TaxID=1478 RepID=UPI0011A7371B|nr:hypothetical protein [Peribacillus simplex]